MARVCTRRHPNNGRRYARRIDLVEQWESASVNVGHNGVFAPEYTGRNTPLRVLR